MPEPTAPSLARGSFWCVLSGFTSFVAHAGGPPYQVYALALGQPPRVYTSTSVAFFATVNLIKLGPYIALGQVNLANLAGSAILMPAAALATLTGAAIVRRMRPQVFYPLMYAMVFLIALKLCWDGLAALV